MDASTSEESCSFCGKGEAEDVRVVEFHDTVEKSESVSATRQIFALCEECVQLAVSALALEEPK